MSGNFDEEGKYVYYSDCNKNVLTYDEKGNLVSNESIFVGGKGSFVFDGETMTWEELAEHAADGMTFTKQA